jgi:hypothetical protein
MAPKGTMMRRVTRLLDDGVLHGAKSGGGSPRYSNLVVDVLDVVIGGLRRDAELVGDLLRREPLAARDMTSTSRRESPAGFCGRLGVASFVSL